MWHRLFLLFAIISSPLCSTPNLNPFGWLENPQDPRTEEWLETQISLFDAYQIHDELNSEIKSSLVALMDTDGYSIPKISKEHYIFLMKRPEDSEAILYMQRGLKSAPEILLDPGLLKGQASVANFIASPSGKYLAYGVSENFSDWLTWRVIDLENNATLLDCVQHIKFSPVVWKDDDSGFFYSRFDVEEVHSIHFHALFTKQSDDLLIYRNPLDQSVGYSPYVSSDNRYLIIDAFNGSSGPNEILYLDLKEEGAKPVMLIPCDGANYWFISSEGSVFYFLTNQNAPKRKLISIDISKEDAPKIDVIREGEFPLVNIAPVGDLFSVVYSENGASKLVLFGRDGTFLSTIPLPSPGRVGLRRIDQNLNGVRSEFFFSFTSFFEPHAIYRYDLIAEKLQPFYRAEVKVDAGAYTTERVFCTSKDGTRVPIFLAYKKGLVLDGDSQALLTGYGAYGISYDPIFDPTFLVWIERGGVLAIAGVRGGGEFGEKWHQDAVGVKKQNSFDDFIASAEWLISNQYTRAPKLAAMGMSSGSLLVATSINQRPDLFGAAVLKGGLLDLTRFHLFTVGRFWIKENGDPDNPSDFEFLLKYSPCHNIQSGVKYPPILVAASENDDRVVPSHSYKYLAALQDALGEDGTFLLRYNKNAGHDSSQAAGHEDEDADILSFIYRELD